MTTISSSNRAELKHHAKKRFFNSFSAFKVEQSKSAEEETNLFSRDKRGLEFDPPSIDAGRLMPVSLMPITFMPVTIDAQEAFLMPVTIDAGHY